MPTTKGFDAVKSTKGFDAARSSRAASLRENGANNALSRDSSKARSSKGFDVSRSTNGFDASTRDSSKARSSKGFDASRSTNGFDASRGSEDFLEAGRSSKGFDYIHAPVHRIMTYSDDHWLELLGKTWERAPSSSLRRRNALRDTQLPADCVLGNASIVKPTHLIKGAGATVCDTPAVLPPVCETPELLPPVLLDAQTCLEEIVTSPHWLRTRGVPQASGGGPQFCGGVPHTGTEPSWGSSTLASRDTATGSWKMQSQSSGISVENAGSLTSSCLGFPRRRPPDLVEAARGQKVAAGPAAVTSQSSSALAGTARQVLADRNHMREAHHRMRCTFTEGRRRVALMTCMEGLECEKADPTLSEVSKRLLQEGYHMDEVKEHLLVLADDTGTWKIKSDRELSEARPPQGSNLPAICKATGPAGPGRSGHAICARKVRNAIDGYRKRYDAGKATISNEKEREIVARAVVPPSVSVSVHY